jgi:hypothetical protein
LCNPSNGQPVAAPASPLKQLHRPAHRPAASSSRATAEGPDRYQFHVVAANVTDVVLSIGGLIYDRAMSGWDVSVVVDGDGGDDRPIRILGATVTTLAALPRPHTLAVAADVLAKNEAVRRMVLAAHNDIATEVLIWGQRRPVNVNGKFVPVLHRPSAAAHVFKSHALAAGGAYSVHPADEGFHSMV